MKKRILTVLLCAIVILTCLTACGGNKASDGNVSSGNVSDSDVSAPDVTVSDEADSATEESETTTVPYVTIPKPDDSREETPFFSDFETVSLDGEEYTQEIFEGNKLTMVNVWGTFCSPCIYEMPFLESISQNYADKGLVVIGVVSDTYDYFKDENSEVKIEKANNIVEETGVTFTNLLPSESLNEARLDYISTFPTTYFLDENGAIIGEYVGSRSYEQWAMVIDTILEAL